MAWTAPQIARAIRFRGYRISDDHIYKILRGDRRPSRALAKNLELVTGIAASMWLLGTIAEIRAAIAGGPEPTKTA